MTKSIEYIVDASPQDINALANLNYKNLDCHIDFKDLLVKKPWGTEYLLFENDFCAIWILNINYMENTSMHCHPKKDTSLICLGGQVSCNTLNQTHALHTLDGLYFSKKIFHQTQSVSKTGSFVLEIETPANKFDLVRINDTYGRQGKEYENTEHYIKEKNLTLCTTNNFTKKINNTIIRLVTISKTTRLDKYHENSLVAIVSKHKDSGKIFRLKDLKLLEKMTIIIISELEVST